MLALTIKFHLRYDGLIDFEAIDANGQSIPPIVLGKDDQVFISAKLNKEEIFNGTFHLASFGDNETLIRIIQQGINDGLKRAGFARRLWLRMRGFFGSW